MRFSALLFVIILFITGCSITEKIEPIEVNIVINPSPVEPNNEINFVATVTQGNEKVEDANVEFEIWKSGVENHKKMEGKYLGEGNYSIKETFTDVGIYNVIAHVTARDMHIMPKREFDVVDLSTNNESQLQSQPINKDHHHDSSDSSVLIHFIGEEEIKVNEKTELKAHITFNDTPLQGGNVSFEVWKENQKHEFIDATESGNGEYVATNVFIESGLYNLNVHVKNDEIHEHQLESIVVD